MDKLKLSGKVARPNSLYFANMAYAIFCAM